MMRRVSYLTTLVFSMLVLLSGEKDEPVSIYSKSIVVSDGISFTSFTADLSATFNGVDKAELALAKKGALYCVKSDNTEGAFKAWKEGNNNPGCTMYDTVNMTGETARCLLKGLSEDTEYSFCFFLQKRDGKREISPVCQFRTMAFKPEIKDVSLDGVQSFVAFAQGGVVIDINDAALCEMGVLVSGHSNTTIENSTVYKCSQFKLGGKKEGTESVLDFTLRLTGLDTNKDYYCRPYIKYPISSNQSGYLYGTEKAFKTKAFQDIAVDLGLTSGNLWAMTNVGADSPEQYGNYFAWAEVNPKTNYTMNNYKWRYDNNKYNTDSTSVYLSSRKNIDLEDDAANYNWGGDWRIPTHEDYCELTDECDWSETSLDGVLGIQITGVNGNSIFIPYGGVITEGSEATLKGSRFYTFTSTLYFGIANGFKYWTYPWGDDPLYLGPGHDFTHQFNRSSGFTIRPVYPVNK